MKQLLSTSILSVWVTVSCCQEVMQVSQKTYEFNSARMKQIGTMTITYAGKTAYIQRDRKQVWESSTVQQNEDMFYVETDSLFINPARLILSDKKAARTWFIPCHMGVKPFKIEPVPGERCLKFYCNCDGIAIVDEEPYCSPAFEDGLLKCLTAEGFFCQTNKFDHCQSAVAVTVCDMDMETDEEHLYYQATWGGVFMEADSVVVTDPDWFVPPRSILFIIDDKENIILKSDYDAMQEELKKKKD